jgi:SAM-dependent methyltransferase
MQRVVSVAHREGIAGVVRRARQRVTSRARLLQQAHPLRWYLSYRLNPARRTGRPPADHRAIRDALLASGIPLEEIDVPVEAYRSYVQAAQYSPETYGSYYYHVAGKSLEHFLSLLYLDLGPAEVLIDIAAAVSPFADIAHRLYGCRAYRQDLIYPPGVQGDRIGGNAAQLPVPDGFATRLVLHNSIEHFENDADIGFVHEAKRVLQPGGICVILPVFMAAHFANMTDPFVDHAGLRFDPGAQVYYVRRWAGGRFSRHYDVTALRARLLANLTDVQVQLIYVRNPEIISHIGDEHFILVFRKPLRS